MNHVKDIFDKLMSVVPPSNMDGIFAFYARKYKQWKKL